MTVADLPVVLPHYLNCLVVSTPLKNMSSSMDVIYAMDNKIHVPNHQPANQRASKIYHPEIKHGNATYSVAVDFPDI